MWKPKLAKIAFSRNPNHVASAEPRLRHTLEQLEVYLIDEFDIVVDYDPAGTDEFWHSDGAAEAGIISINSSHSLEEMVNILAHEAGHVLLRRTLTADGRNDFYIRFPNQDSDSDIGRIEVFREEVLAWEKGRELLENLELCYIVPCWRESYRKALLNYAKWVSSETNEN